MQRSTGPYSQEVISPRDSEYQKQQDAWQRYVSLQVAIAIASYCEQARIKTRRIETLKIDDFEAIGQAACAAYVDARIQWGLAHSEKGNLTDEELARLSAI